MSTTRYARGSEWRRWDLQVHTPCSELNNGFGSDFEAYAKSFFEHALDKGIAVVGVTDYFSIEGYRRLRDMVETPGKLESLLGTQAAIHARQIRLLPNIEMRSSMVLTDSAGRQSRVNFHVIFSDDLSPDLIEEHFLREVKFSAESKPGGRDEKWSLTRTNFESLGADLQAEHEPFRDRSPYFIGLMNAVVAHEDVTSVLERQDSRFKDRYLLLVPADEDLSLLNWDGQGHQSRKLLLQKSHMFFSANPGTRAFALGKKHASREDFIREFKSLKPCVHGSDAHSLETLFQPALNRQLWVKADPTFDGVCHLLHEPESRLFVGTEPPALARVARKATKYMKELRFERLQPGRGDDVWFSESVPLNSGLVAVIGNKGSGKSALTDILALVGNASNPQDFSFLTKERFLSPKTGLAKMFRATVEWFGGPARSKTLSDGVKSHEPELVKYLPQDYLETICTELGSSGESRFDQELREVIYSHVDEADRLGQATLSELIEYLGSVREATIRKLEEELPDINREIVSLKAQTSDDFRASIESQLDQLRAEVEAHKLAMPVEVAEPSSSESSPDPNKDIKSRLVELVEKSERADKEIADSRERLRLAAQKATAAERLLARMANLESQVESFYIDSDEDANILGLTVRDAVNLTIDRDPIRIAKLAAESESKLERLALDPALEESLVSRRAALSRETEVTREKLDEPNRRRQAYLHDLANWNKRNEELIGSASAPQSLRGLEARLESLKSLPEAIEERRQQRVEVVKQIFAAKESLLTEYQRIHSPVQKFIDTHPVSKEHGALQFSAAINVTGFEDGFLGFIHHGRRGSFQGEADARERVRELIARSDFSTAEGVLVFLNEIEVQLERDLREGVGKPILLRDQLRQGVAPEQVMDFLYGLGYLTPKFELRWRGKQLAQLSPGERGNLLLVFYLLIDSRDVPLIIDQPEENLDNQTIASMVVPAIKYAKENRQIIIVTHNPNLAVVCDAEQIIHASIDKTGGNRVEYVSGSIEDPAITALIMDVLEGTKPAFDLRDAKYGVLDRTGAASIGG